MTPEQEPLQQLPQATGPVAPRKPVRGWIWGFGVTIAVVLFAIVLFLFSAIHGGNQQNRPVPETASPGAVNGFQVGNNAEAARLKKQGDNLKGLGATPTEPTPDVDDSEATANLIKKNGNQGSNATGSATPRVATAAEKRKAAFESSAITIDFTAQESKPEQAAPQQTAPPTPRQEEPVPTKEARSTNLDDCPYTGKLYKLFIGQHIDAVLLNRLVGDFTGPVETMATDFKYTLNNQTLLVPQGTKFIGQATKTGTDQERLAVSFHAMVMPDGCAVNLDQFTGLDQIGATALRDQVNHHWMRAFGFSIALGAIGGLAQIGNSTSGFGYDPGVSLRVGISQQMGQEATQIFNRLTNPMPTVTIRERNRVKVYFEKTILLPAYANHVIDKDP